VITIDIERCTGCAACVEVCPTGALYLVDGKATVDKALCHGCEACLAACPHEAIILTEQAKPMAEAARLPAVRPEPEVIRVRTRATPVPFRSRVLPLAGSALVWLEREILPWLADLLDRRTIQRPTSIGARSRETPAPGAEGNGRQHRRRRRGGGWS
jgi:NAD-dependent dihydropyrimidine dehydrogenase PreA subunit